MYIIVLNDGETFANLDRCSIVRVPDHFDTDMIEQDLRALKDGEETELETVIYLHDWTR